MSDDLKYTYSIYPVATAVSVLEEQPLQFEWGYHKHVDLPMRGASWHHLRGISTLSDDPVGLIELADGSVIAHEDMRGMWDPKDADVELLESTIEALHATESDFFARQLAEIDKDIYALKYPAYVVGRALGAPSLSMVPSPPTWRVRLRAWFGALRYRLGSWVAGMPLGADEGDD